MNNQEFFYQSFLELQTTDEVKNYLRDLLTMEEISEFSNRLTVANMLAQKATYIEITEKTSMSSTTIARINKWLTGGQSGYTTVLERLNHHHASTKPRLRAE